MALKLLFEPNRRTASLSSKKIRSMMTAASIRSTVVNVYKTGWEHPWGLSATGTQCPPLDRMDVRTRSEPQSGPGSAAKFTLPPPDIDASLKELERVIEAPGVVGITIGPDLAEFPELSGAVRKSRHTNGIP